jgi:hypothetical protein
MWKDRIKKLSFQVWNVTDPYLIHGQFLLAIYRTMYRDVGKPTLYYITPNLQLYMGLTMFYGAFTQSPFWTLSSIYNFFFKTHRFVLQVKKHLTWWAAVEQDIFSRWTNTQKHSTCEDMCLRTNQAQA